MKRRRRRRTTQGRTEYTLRNAYDENLRPSRTDAEALGVGRGCLAHLSPDFGTACEIAEPLWRQAFDKAIICRYGEMAEWSKAPDSKSGLGQPNGGSNPSLSARFTYCLQYSLREEREGEKPLFAERREQCERREGARGEAHAGPEPGSERARDARIALRRDAHNPSLRHSPAVAHRICLNA
jgi:hypothetical protein